MDKNACCTIYRSKRNLVWARNECKIPCYYCSLVDLVPIWRTGMTVFYHSMVSIRKDSYSCFQPSVVRLSKKILHPDDSYLIRMQQGCLHFLSKHITAFILLLTLLQTIHNKEYRTTNKITHIST